MPFYKQFMPSPALSGLIRAFEIYQVNWHSGENLPDPFITCLANTEQCLYFYINDPIRIVPAQNVEIPVPPVVVTGPKNKPVGLMFGKDHLMVKVIFHPTGTYRLLGLNMTETVNNGLDATRFWGDALNDILQQLRKADSHDHMVDIISTFIEAKFDVRCRPEEPIDLVAIKMLDHSHNHAQAEWATMACLSLRQFERNFMTRTGITPKLFIRIVRFEHAMRVKNASPEKSWSQIAAECRYTDSSHLLREFKEFAEFPPSRFYAQPTSGHSEFPTG
ncbi:helix-turn-helix domain-containing protein [Chryseolinea lacunae]|uniref:AraC family transcriptional regulator n=1 Tax=Chryseolinea lacunae TaxID=2801331 RepID=A0ABS1L4Q8_9BACT|nr:helix-turn-helix domain-containing protein [Chryseolinea lacunae]MBL0745551.1 AraC family transcriptional regulator [Chryseolinea lacunae]